MPPGFSCQNAARSETQSFSSLFIGGRQMRRRRVPRSAADAKGHLVTLNDLTYAEKLGAKARSHLSLVLGAIILISVGLATLAALIVVRWRMNKLQRSIAKEAQARRLRAR